MPKSKQEIKRRVKLANKARKHNKEAIPSFISVNKEEGSFTIERKKPFPFGKLISFKYKLSKFDKVKKLISLRVMENNRIQSANIYYDMKPFDLQSHHNKKYYN